MVGVVYRGVELELSSLCADGLGYRLIRGTSIFGGNCFLSWKINDCRGRAKYRNRKIVINKWKV